MTTLLVDVPHETEIGIKRSWDEYVTHATEEEGLFYLCTSLIGTGIDSPNFAESNIKRLEKEIEAGARMVKVWKNFGMVTKDESGKFIQIDDSRLQPIWDYLAGQGIPVIAHIGEPLQAWRKLDPKSPHYGYYKDHPEYHAFKIPEIPSYETIIEARDRWIEKNPKLTILCAHLGSMSHDVDMVAERLDKYPNISVEPGARFGDLAGQDSKKVKAFFIKYQDRILFGSDYGNGSIESQMSGEDLEREKKDLINKYSLLFKYLSSSDEFELRNILTSGLNLPPEVLSKVYYENAAKLLKIGDL